MNNPAWLWLAMVVVLGTAGQLALKYALRPGRGGNSGVRLIFNPAIMLWIVCYVATTILWLMALRSVPLSQAFPILGLQFALIPIAAWHFLDETISPAQWIGISVIVVGVALVGKT